LKLIEAYLLVSLKPLCRSITYDFCHEIGYYANLKLLCTVHANISFQVFAKKLIHLISTDLVIQCTTYVWNIQRKNSEVYSIQHYVIKFVIDLWQVGGFLWVLRIPPSIKLDTTI